MHSELHNIFSARSSSWASEIEPDFLFLGSGNAAAELKELRAHKITHVLNCADDVENFFDGEFTYLRLEIEDFGQDKGISRVFGDAFKFLEEVKASQQRVLVHCAAGANRSASVVIAWIMHSRQLSLKEAFKVVKSKRKGISPLRDNRLELWRFEQSRSGKNSVTEEELMKL